VKKASAIGQRATAAAATAAMAPFGFLSLPRSMMIFRKRHRQLKFMRPCCRNGCRIEIARAIKDSPMLG